jgi:hypothetical protein
MHKSLKVNMVIKQNPKGTVCINACLCLERRKVSLDLHEANHQALGLILLLDVVTA